MLSSQEFDDWCRRLNLPEVGKKVIEEWKPQACIGEIISVATQPIRQKPRWAMDLSASF